MTLEYAPEVTRRPWNVAQMSPSDQPVGQNRCSQMQPAVLEAT